MENEGGVISDKKRAEGEAVKAFLEASAAKDSHSMLANAISWSLARNAVSEENRAVIEERHAAVEERHAAVEERHAAIEAKHASLEEKRTQLDNRTLLYQEANTKWLKTTAITLVLFAVLFMIALPVVLFFGFNRITHSIEQLLQVASIAYRTCAGSRSFVASMCNLVYNTTLHKEMARVFEDAANM